MPVEPYDVRKQFETGVVILSLDTEQIWGYLDQMNETQFRNRYPDALGAQEKLLACLSNAGVSATWFMVGGMALRGSDGARDLRMAGLPDDWTARIPGGVEATAPLWYRHSFVERLRKARPFQEIGLHGGLTHLIWTDARATREVVKRELAEGVKALEQALVRPLSFLVRTRTGGVPRTAAGTRHPLLPGPHCDARLPARTDTSRERWRAFSMNCAARRLRRCGRKRLCRAFGTFHPRLFLYPIGAVENQSGRIAIPRRAVQPRTGGRGPPSRDLSLLPSSRKSDRIAARLFHVRRHPGAADSSPRPWGCRNSDDGRGSCPDGARARERTAGPGCRHAVRLPCRSECRRESKQTRKDTSMIHQKQHSHS